MTPIEEIKTIVEAIEADVRVGRIDWNVLTKQIVALKGFVKEAQEQDGVLRSKLAENVAKAKSFEEIQKGFAKIRDLLS